MSLSKVNIPGVSKFKSFIHYIQDLNQKLEKYHMDAFEKHGKTVKAQVKQATEFGSKK